MDRPILNIADLEYDVYQHGDTFYSRMGEIGGKLGSLKLGYNLTVVPPGKRAWPFHNHRVNEEMFFVIEGAGELRAGTQRYPIRSGDVIASLPGGPEVAHQIVNTSDSAELKYLAVSTMLTPEIVEYPDSDKVGFRGVFPSPTAADGEERFRVTMRRQALKDEYWDGE